MTYLKSKYVVITTDYLLPTLLFLCSLFVIYLLFFSSLFTVQTLACTQDFEPCNNPYILSEIDKLKGQNLFLLKTDQVIARLKSGDFQTRDGQIKKVLPTSLSFSLQSVYPVLALQISTDSRFVTLDSNLRVLKTTESNPNVPIIEVSKPLSFQIGKPVPDSELSQALPFVYEVARSLPKISRIVLSDQTITLKLASSPSVVMTPLRSASEQISALKAILEDATISEGVRQIDVRFAQPILAKD